jgi:myo-inositol-1(or 4)-monophosphatase
MDNNSLPLSQTQKTPLEIATKAALKAGKLIVDRFCDLKEIKHKSRGNLVTEIDTLSENLILEILKEEYPEYQILSEETNSSTSISGYAWVVDPLDGTNNYVFGIPNFCINIALVNNDDTVMGITYDPLRKELFSAEKDKGAYLNGLRTKVSQVSLLKDALLGFDLGYNEEQGKKILDITSKLWGKVHCIRMMGSSALGLAYVACGRMSLYYHRYLYPWDIASGILMVRESGGRVTDWQGNNNVNFQAKEIIASNSSLSRQLFEFLG